MDNTEWFDVVDALDRPIGRERREVVHSRELFHRAIHVFVLDAAGRMLVQKRSMLKDSAAGLWCSSCSGHLDTGEDYLGAAVRELEEELGAAARQCSLSHPRRDSQASGIPWGPSDLLWSILI